MQGVVEGRVAADVGGISGLSNLGTGLLVQKEQSATSSDINVSYAFTLD